MRCDVERRPGSVRGPLDGIPVLLKDNIDTADRMATTAGSLALANSLPSSDAFLVTRLRAAGAVILGKTNLSEWANFRSHAVDRAAGAVAAGRRATRTPSTAILRVELRLGWRRRGDLATVGVGTETDGCIVCPAALNGLVGIKPTVGLVSRSGIIPISHSQDTAGPMARTVADAAAVADRHGRSGSGRGGRRTRARRASPSTTPRFLHAPGLRGARIGVLRKSIGFRARCGRGDGTAIVAMRAWGATMIDPEDPDRRPVGRRREFTLLIYEFRPVLEAYLARRPAPPRHAGRLDRVDELHADAEMPYFAQELFDGRWPKDRSPTAPT